jgi:hypothetical protein
MAIKLSAFDWLRGRLSDAKGALTPGERFVAGGAAGALAQVIVSQLANPGLIKSRGGE